MRSLVIVLAALLCTPGCLVKKQVHDAALAQLQSVTTERHELRDQLASTLEELAAERARTDVLEAQLADLEERRSTLQAENLELRQLIELGGERMQQLLADAEAVHAQMLEVQQQRDLIEEQSAALTQQLEEATQALEAYRQRIAEAEERDRISQQLRERLQSLIDAGDLDLRITDGRMVLELGQDVLFASGSAELSSEGEETLRVVAAALARFPDRSFQVEGHTDDQPISSPTFPSNWELSAARALNVLRVLTREGVAPEALSAAGFGEFRPRAANDSEEGRAQNRRIEIVMTTNLDLLREEVAAEAPQEDATPTDPPSAAGTDE